VGQALKETKGKANPKVVTQILQERLEAWYLLDVKPIFWTRMTRIERIKKDFQN
jgi:hypothetical protein